MPRLRRLGIGAAIGVFALVAVAVVILALGTPMAAQVPPSAAAPAGVTPETASSEAATVAGQEAAAREAASPEATESPGAVEPAQDPSSSGGGGSDPLAIEIPGCVCHSDNAALVAEHAGYRMSECFGCHGDSMPTMGR